MKSSQKQARKMVGESIHPGIRGSLNVCLLLDVSSSSPIRGQTGAGWLWTVSARFSKREMNNVDSEQKPGPEITVSSWADETAHITAAFWGCQRQDLHNKQRSQRHRPWLGQSGGAKRDMKLGRAMTAETAGVSTEAAGGPLALEAATTQQGGRDVGMLSRVDDDEVAGAMQGRG